MRRELGRESMAEQAEMIVFGVTFAGAEKAAADMGALATGSKKLDGEVNKLSTDMKTAGTSAQKMGSDVAAGGQKAAKGLTTFQDAGRKAATVVGSLGGAVGQLSPQLGQLTGGVGRASAAMGAFGTLVGGPVAIGIGVATLALGELVTWYARAEKAAENLRAKTAETGQEIADLLGKSSPELRAIDAQIDRLGELQIARIKAGQTRSAGEASEEKAAIALLQARRAALGGTSKVMLEGGSVVTEEAGAIQFSDTPAKKRAAGGGGSRSGRDPNAAKADKFLADSFATPSSGGSVGTGFEFAGAQSFDAMIEEHAAAGQQMLDAEALYQSEADAGRKWAHDEEMKRLEERRAVEAKNREMALAGVQILGNTMISTLQAAAKGQKVTARAIVGTIGDQLVASGTRTLWEGIALSANPLMPGSGAGMIGVGTGMIAVGIGMGAAGASGGGKGGGGGSRRADNNAPQAVSPNATTRGINNGSNGQPIVINMPTVVSPGAEDGRRVRLALQEADRRGV